jgi:hypothetical protein
MGPEIGYCHVVVLGKMQFCTMLFFYGTLGEITDGMDVHSITWLNDRLISTMVPDFLSDLRPLFALRFIGASINPSIGID